MDFSSPEEIAAQKGSPTVPGTPNRYRDTSPEENLALFERMKNGEFPDGARVLRAKIDMASPIINLRDPVMYRILHAEHHRTGNQWCIYPMYDWAHGQSDSIEGITHSICTLEFENHRPLYDWYLDALGVHHPQQIEFAKLNLTYIVLSKRRLIQLVKDGYVSGWDDPRMPTIAAFRRRGVTPEAIQSFVSAVGVAKANSTIDLALFEYHIRQNLNAHALRRMAVLNPLKVVITNYPEGQTDMLDAINNPEDESAGSRQVPFSRELYIEQDDFMEDPPKKYFRLSPGVEVRLRYGYFITCTDVVKDADGKVVEIHCTYDPTTRGGQAPDGRKVKGTIHWVSAAHAVDAEVRLYDRLYTKEDPMDMPEGQTFLDAINPDALVVLNDCKLEPSLAEATTQDRFQFERVGYFCLDYDSQPGKLVFNRTITLKDAWAKMAGK